MCETEVAAAPLSILLISVSNVLSFVAFRLRCSTNANSPDGSPSIAFHSADSSPHDSANWRRLKVKRTTDGIMRNVIKESRGSAASRWFLCDCRSNGFHRCPALLFFRWNYIADFLIGIASCSLAAYTRKSFAMLSLPRRRRFPDACTSGSRGLIKIFDTML